VAVKGTDSVVSYLSRERISISSDIRDDLATSLAFYLFNEILSLFA